MKHTLKYFFSFCLLILTFIVKAQDNKKEVFTSSKMIKADSIVNPPKKKNNVVVSEILPKDSIKTVKKDRYGLRLGADLFKITRGFYDNNYRGIELVGDYRISKKHFLAVEIGAENKTTVDDRLTTTSKGSYLKFGFDYNAYENWLDMENIISAGLRASFSTFNQELNNYRIYNRNQYWNDSQAINSGQNFGGLSAVWVETVGSMKVKVFNNVFAGFSLRLYLLLSQKQPGNFKNLYIPGFGRTYDGSFGAGFNYTITYFVPLYKKASQPKKK